MKLLLCCVEYDIFSDFLKYDENRRTIISKDNIQFVVISTSGPVILGRFSSFYRFKPDLKYQKSFKWIFLNQIDKNMQFIMNFI